MFLRAASMAFWIATGTSRALPRPKPTLPLPSPTTVRAVNAKMRSPLTVLATRLTCTSFSWKPSLLPSSFLAYAIFQPLEFQSSFTRSFGQCLDPPVVFEATAIKGNARYTSGFCTFGHQCTNQFSGFRITGFTGTQILIQRGGARDHACTIFSNNLRVYVTRSTMNCQAVYAQLTNLSSGTTRSAKTRLLLIAHILGPTSSWLLYDVLLRQSTGRLCLCTALARAMREFPT